MVLDKKQITFDTNHSNLKSLRENEKPEISKVASQTMPDFQKFNQNYKTNGLCVV